MATRVLTDTDTITWDESTANQVKGNVGGSPSIVNLTQSGYHDLTEISEPSNPSANVMRMFARDVSGRTDLALKNSNGDVLELLRIGNVKNYGASPSASAATNTTAFQAALDATNAIEIPAGTYDLSAKLTAAKPVVIEGAGMSSTILRWTSGAASEGIEITPTNAFRNAPVSQVGNLSLLTAKDAVGTALKFDYSAFISGGTSIPRATAHAKVYRVLIQGATDYVTDGWLNGIDFTSCQACTVESCRINGHYNNPFGTVPSSEKGISFGGPGAPVQLVVSKSWISAWQTGIYSYEVEGFYVTNCELVTCDIGIDIDNTAEEPLAFITATHIAAISKCIQASNANAVVVNGGWFSPISPQSGDFIGIHILAGCSDCIISNVVFIRSNITSLYRAIVEDGGDDTLITGCNFAPGSSVGCIGIDINAGAERTRVANDNVFSNANVEIDNASTTAILANTIYDDGDNASTQGLRLEGHRATPADGDTIYASFYLANDADERIEYGRITCLATDVSDATEDSALSFSTLSAGTLAARARLSSADFTPNSDGGISLGSTSLRWNHLRLNGSIDLGDPDTTISRLSAGDIGIEGNIAYRAGGTDVPLTDGGTGASTARAACANLDTWNLLGKSAVAVPHTGNTNETALATISVPAGAMGPNGALRVTAMFSMTNNANNKTPRLRLGGISGTGFYFVAHASIATIMLQRVIHNRNSEASQVSFPGSSLTSYGTSTSAPTTGTQNTAGALDLVLSGQLADGADTITLESYQVEVLYGA
jgi:hypothetical protein